MLSYYGFFNNDVNWNNLLKKLLAIVKGEICLNNFLSCEQFLEAFKLLWESRVKCFIEIWGILSF